MPQQKRLGGIIHTYQKYDPQSFPSPTQPPPDLASPAMEHLLQFGNTRRLSEEELARAIRLDPSQITGLGPSLDALKAMLEERKRRILETYETSAVLKTAHSDYRDFGEACSPPRHLKGMYEKAFEEEQIYDFEKLWYAIGDDASPFARSVIQLIDRLGDKYQVEELASKYEFTGRTEMSVPKAIEIKQELEKIDALLKQLEEAMENAQIALIDIESLAEFAEPGDLQRLEEMQRMVENYIREEAARQGVNRDSAGFSLTPHALRLFQGRLLERIFSELQASRTGRHSGPIEGEGAVELQQTRPYEFGDSITQMDIPQTFVNAMLRQGDRLPLRLKAEDIEIHRTRNSPKCATVVIMDMSGSMRYDGQYMNVKRMALALEGLIRREYPGDFLHFIEMYTFGKVCPPSRIVELMPKPVSIYDPVVRLRADMSDESISEYQIPHHFTNIQHSLQLARQFLAAQDTPNRQIILITDGLPTAHFEGSELFMLYPPNPRTEEATLREGMLCKKEEITINMFLIPSWSQSQEDIRFAYRLAESTTGRVFFTAGNDLDRFVVWDYVQQKREIIG